MSTNGTPSLLSVQEHLSTLSCPYHPAKKESKCLLGRGGMRGGLTGVSGDLVASHVRKEQALVIYTAGYTQHETKQESGQQKVRFTHHTTGREGLHKMHKNKSMSSRQRVRTAVVGRHSRLLIVLANIATQGLCADFLGHAVALKSVRGEKVNSC